MAQTVKNGATPKRVVKKEKSKIVLIKNLSDFTLSGEEVELIYEVTFSVNSKTGGLTPIRRKRIDEVSKPIEYTLREVFPEDLLKIRYNKVSGMLLKEGYYFYFVEIPRKSHFTESFFWSAHLCNSCKMFSALEWGCPKVRDTHLNLELYPFITTGIEAVNLEKDFTFFVCKCENHK